SKSIAARSFSTRSTPSWVSASLSRVCEAASTYSFSSCLSLMSAWFRLASPWITLMRSYTTRRSQPMIRSRLRSPTSKSITATLCPASARPAEKLALVVVLPTPPLPEVTTTILAIRVVLSEFQRVDHQRVAGQAHLRRLALHACRQAAVGGAIDARHGAQQR